MSVSLARPQLASTTEIPAEAKATTVFLSGTTSMIKDSVPKLKIDFLNNHCSAPPGEGSPHPKKKGQNK